MEIAGFRFAGMACGIKKAGGKDLALVVADRPVSTAALFTQNQVKAAPVRIASARLASGRAQAILVNSGNANACTGRAGIEAALRASAAIAEKLAIDPSAVLPASTGVIGEPLPVEKIESAAESLVSGLSSSAEAFAEAILTTDRGRKVAEASYESSDGRKLRLLGIAKGAGMIHPNMATTLAFVFTDATVEPELLRSMLGAAGDATFGRISVDGDTSTNDMLALMASGAAGAAPIEAGSADEQAFRRALEEVLQHLALAIVADGEGAEHLVELRVSGLASDEDALKVARTIATSLLSKTALFGRDPNWGRFLAAAGRAGVQFDSEQAEIFIGDVAVVREGVDLGPNSTDRAKAEMGKARYAITLRLGQGPGKAHYYTCDIGSEYLRINAGYRT